MDRTQVMENKIMFMYHMSVSGRDMVGVFIHCTGHIYQAGAKGTGSCIWHSQINEFA